MDQPAPHPWADDLLASKAEIESSEQVPMQPVLDRMQAAIERLRASKPGSQ